MNVGKIAFGIGFFVLKVEIQANSFQIAKNGRRHHHSRSQARDQAKQRFENGVKLSRSIAASVTISIQFKIYITSKPRDSR